MKTELENSYLADFKRAVKQGLIDDKTQQILNQVVETLLSGETLDPKHKDHPLKGDYRGYRDCHVKPDLVLIYKITDNVLHLVRLGAHREIFKNY